MSSYPNNYPEKCPPMEIDPIPEKCYRLITRNGECKPKDFQSDYEKNGHQYYDGQSWCTQRAVSVFSDRNEAVNLVLQRPRMIQRYIATLKLNFEDGDMQHSPQPANGDSHYDWWISKKFDCSKSCINIEGPIDGGVL